MPRARDKGELDGLLDACAQAFEDGEHARVLELAAAAVKLDPGCAEAWHYDAAAHLELGELDAAEAGYRRALELAPDDPELLAGAADLFVCHLGEERDGVTFGLELCRRGQKVARRQDDVELLHQFLVLEGIGLNQLGEAEAALRALSAALELAPDDVEAGVEHAIAQFELCRFEAARTQLQRLERRHPDDAWIHYYLGLLAERAGDGKEAARRFERARTLQPQEFPEPVRLSDEEFDKAVEDAIAALPAHVKKYLDNTTIAVEEIPPQEDLLASSPPLSPTILGVFRGTPVGERSVSNAADHVTASIALYQRNLERFARTREELIEQIGITVMHEVGHLLGLDEEDLWERGLE